MTMTLPASTPVPARPVWRERLFCAVVGLTGLIEAVSATIDLVLIGDITSSPDLSPRGLVKLAPMVLHLLLALAALGFAVTGRLRFAVAALAVWALVRWACSLLILGGLNSFPEVHAFNIALCAAALVAVWRNQYLGAATLAVAALTVFDLGAITLFAVGVFLFGYGP